MKDLKYLIAYITPLSVAWALYAGGWASYAGVIVAFVIIPLVELLHPGSPQNMEADEEHQKLKMRFFDLLLYFNVGIVWGIAGFYLHRMSQGGLAWWEVLGMTLSTGIILGGNGINVGHELGHRDTWYERMMAKMLLLPSFYLHFIIEHNLGHHKWVSTDKDPASAHFNEPVYRFIFRSSVMGYFSAWNIANTLTERKGHSRYHILRNPMYGYNLWQILYLVAVGLYWGWAIVPYALVVGILGFLLLETVNYIEHYGLRRQKLPSGRYEPVKPHHSWNSNHELGRIFLYELTRHSDHHYKANRKYQILRHFDESPQLPLGYPGSILLALVPPLWFAYMNPKVEQVRKRFGMVA